VEEEEGASAAKINAVGAAAKLELASVKLDSASSDESSNRIGEVSTGVASNADAEAAEEGVRRTPPSLSALAGAASSGLMLSGDARNSSLPALASASSASSSGVSSSVPSPVSRFTCTRCGASATSASSLSLSSLLLPPAPRRFRSSLLVLSSVSEESWAGGGGDRRFGFFRTAAVSIGIAASNRTTPLSLGAEPPTSPAG
jgi:hypothetical protein